MAECWAREHGECDGKLSREHLLSRALLYGTVTVQGQPWGSQERTIGRDSFTGRILCERHNNALSPADAEAKRSQDAIAWLRIPHIDGPTRRIEHGRSPSWSVVL